VTIQARAELLIARSKRSGGKRWTCALACWKVTLRSSSAWASSRGRSIAGAETSTPSALPAWAVRAACRVVCPVPQRCRGCGRGAGRQRLAAVPRCAAVARRRSRWGRACVHFRPVASLSFHDGRGRLAAVDNRYSSWMAPRHSASWGRVGSTETGRTPEPVWEGMRRCRLGGSAGSLCSAAYISRRSASSCGRLSAGVCRPTKSARGPTVDPCPKLNSESDSNQPNHTLT
jgi:hypothetical protein